MKTKIEHVLITLAAATFIVPAALAQQPPPDKVATVAAPANSAAKAAFSLQTPIEQLMAEPSARDAVESVLPGIANHRRYEEFKSMSFDELQPMAPNMLTPDRLARLAEALAQIGSKPAKPN